MVRIPQCLSVTVAFVLQCNILAWTGSAIANPPQTTPGLPVPKALFRGPPLDQQAVPTNQWYSSALFKNPSAVIHAHPMSYRINRDGFELSLPTMETLTSQGIANTIRFNHHPDIVVEPESFVAVKGVISRVSHWLVTAEFKGPNQQSMEVRFLHGSPYSYYTLTTGSARVQFSQRIDPPQEMRQGQFRGLIVKVGQRHYSINIPTSADWEMNSRGELIIHFVGGHRYFSVAGLPDSTPESEQEIIRHGMVFPTEAHFSYSYDAEHALIKTHFSMDSDRMEGDERSLLIGVYPHHVKHLVGSDNQKIQTSTLVYNSIRGPIRLLSQNEFVTTLTYHGLVPSFGSVRDPSTTGLINRQLSSDTSLTVNRLKPQVLGPYWAGKSLGAAAQLLDIATAQSQAQASERLTQAMTHQMEMWSDHQHPGHFVKDQKLGAVFGLPEEFGSIQSINDHHFHYGYWIGAAAHLALYNNNFSKNARIKAMIEQLISDIASTSDSSSSFPYVRNYDVYEGHSWASGTALSDDGNNQESSSEAIHTWANLLLWAEATHQPELRNLAAVLYTQEIDAAQQYWFDLDHTNFSSTYSRPFASLVFGGKYTFATWWTDEPRQIYGINLLPITPAATYLATDPDYLRKYISSVAQERQRYNAHKNSDGTSDDVWQDIFAEAFALIDAEAATRLWNSAGSIENGESKTHTVYWLSVLKEIGQPDFSVTANTTLYAVFKKNHLKTYICFNAGDEPITVKYSDGFTLIAPAHQLVRKTEG